MGGKQKSPIFFFVEHQLNNMGTLLYTQLSLDCGVFVALVVIVVCVGFGWVVLAAGFLQSTTEN